MITLLWTVGANSSLYYWLEKATTMEGILELLSNTCVSCSLLINLLCFPGNFRVDGRTDYLSVQLNLISTVQNKVTANNLRGDKETRMAIIT